MKNPDPIYKVILGSVKLVFIGLFLLLINNLITHLILFANPNGKYYLTGHRGIFFHIGLIIILFVPIKQYIEITTLRNVYVKSTEKYILYLSWSVIAISLGLEYIINSRILDFIFLIGILAFIIIFTNVTINYPKTMKRQNNPVYKLRSKILKISALLFLGFFINIGYFYLSNNQMDSINIEIYIWNNTFIPLLIVTFIFLNICLPRWLLLKAGITEEEFLFNRHPVLDYHWGGNPDKIGITSTSIYYPKTDKTKREVDQENKKSDVIFIKKISSMDSVGQDKTIHSIYDQFKPDEVISYTQYNEEYIQRVLLPNNSIVLISSHAEGLNEDSLHFVKDLFGYSIKYGPTLYIDKFYYDTEEYGYSILSIIPSPWNIRKKMWIIYAKNDLLSITCNFLADYLEFFKIEGTKKPFVVIMKFPKDGIFYNPIPKGIGNSPNLNYIDFV